MLAAELHSPARSRRGPYRALTNQLSPTGKVYIEYWGLERDPKYATRKQAKLDLYHRYGFNLIELTDEHIRSLDDCLPRLLLRMGVAVS